MLPSGKLDRLVTIEAPTADDSFTGAGSGTWAEHVKVRAWIEDMLPSRGEKLANGFNVATRPARVRIRYREDITPNMRLVLGQRVMQIIAGPVELGNREGLELMVEDYGSAGNPA